ncbi:MAG: ZIP family metal transporter [Bacteroidota bacterium]
MTHFRYLKGMLLGQYLLLFLTVIIGGASAFYLRRQNQSNLQLALSFSGAYLLGISVLHLMPTVFAGGEESVGLWVLLGFFIQLFLEQLSGGVEHGHLHVHDKASTGFAVQVMLGLCLHAFIEGMPLANYEDFHQALPGHEHHSEHLLIGIILHKVPAAFALVLLLLFSNYRERLVWFCLVLFAFMSPLGAALVHLVAGGEPLSPQIMHILLAIVVGSFLHIATTILFEVDSSHRHRIPWKRLLAIVVGISGALLTLL